jgi:hypothetical protein
LRGGTAAGEPEIDATGKEAFRQKRVAGDLQGAVERQQDSRRPYPDALSHPGDDGGEYLRARGVDVGTPVLRQPVALVAETFGENSRLDSVTETALSPAIHSNIAKVQQA